MNFRRSKRSGGKRRNLREARRRVRYLSRESEALRDSMRAARRLHGQGLA